MSSILRAVGSFIFSPKELTLSGCTSNLEELEKKVSAESLEDFIQNYSLLRRDSKVADEDYISHFAAIRGIAKAFQKECKDSAQSTHIEQFIQEFDSVEISKKFEEELFTLQGYASKQALVEHFDKKACFYEQVSKGKPAWIYISENIYIRLDSDKGVLTLVNNEEKEQRYNEPMEVYVPSENTSNLGIMRRKYFYYHFDAEKNKQDKGLFIALSRMSQYSDKVKFFNEHVIPYAQLSLKSSDNFEDIHEYVSKNENTLDLLLHCAVIGVFSAPSKKHSDLLYRNFLYFQGLGKVVELVNLASNEQELLKCEAHFQALIVEANFLHEKNMLFIEDIKILDATYQDTLLKKAHFSFTAKAVEIEKVSLYVNCSTSGLESKFPQVKSTASRSLCPINPQFHGMQQKIQRVLSPRSTGLLNAVKRMKEWKSPDNFNFQELEKIADELNAMAESYLQEVSLQKDVQGNILEVNKPSLARTEEQQNDTYLNLQDYFKEVINQIPIPALDPENFWNTIESPEAHLIALNKLNQALHRFLNAYDESIILEGMVLNYQLLACMDFLCRKNPDAHLDNFKTYHYEYIKLLMHPQCVIEDANVQKKAFAIAKYFRPNCSVHELVLGGNWTWEECAEEVQKSTFALMSVDVKKNFLNQTTRVQPLTWQPDTPQKECQDKLSQTYAYYKQFIDHPGMMEAWKALGEKAPQTESEKVLWITFESLKEDSLLPLEVTLLQKAAVRAIALNYLSKESNYNNAIVKPVIVYEKNDQQQFLRSFSSLYIQVDAPKVRNAHPDLEQSEVQEWEGKNRFFSFSEKQLMGKAPIWRMEGNSFKLSGASSLSGPSQNKILNDYTSYSDIEYFQVWANPLDCLNRWVNLLVKNISLLDNPTKRKEFFDACFQFGRMEVQFFCQPAFSFRLKGWLRDAIFFALAHSKYELLKELCEFSEKLVKFIQNLDVKTIDEGCFSNVVTWLKDEISPLCTSAQDKFWLHLNIINMSSIKGAVNVNSLTSYAIVLFTKKYIPLSDQQNIHEISGCFKSLFSAKYEECGLEVFNAVAEIYNIPKDNEVAVASNKILSGKYEVDLETYEVKMNGVPLMHRIPAQVLNKKDFKNYYGIKLNTFIHEDYYNDYDLSLEGAYYVLTPKEGKSDLQTYYVSSFKINLNASETVPVLEMKKNGKVYVLVTLSEFRYFSSDNLWLEEGKDTIWQEKGTDHFIIENNQKFKAEIFCKSAAQGAVMLTPSKVILKDRTLLSANQLPHNLVALFEKLHRASAIQFWVNTTTRKLERIVLPDCKLSFTVDDQSRILCDQYNGYYVVERHARHPVLNSFQKSLLLVNKDNQFKEILINPKDRLSFFEFDYVGDQLDPQGNGSCLFLISEYVKNNLFSQAAVLIENLSNLFELKKFEESFLKTLQEQLKNTQHSKAVALELKLAIYMYEQQILHKDDVMDVKALLKLYWDFLAVRGDCIDCNLSVREETRLLEILISYFDEKLEERISPSINTYWAYYVDIKRRDFLQLRLEHLRGKEVLTAHTLPLARDVTNTVIQDVPVGALLTNLEVLSNRITAKLNAIKKTSGLRWVEPASLKEELLLAADLFQIIRPISISEPPSLTDLTLNFFVYYKFLCEEATDHERRCFEKSLLLIPDASGIVFTLRKVCQSPKGRISIESLVALQRTINASGSIVTWLNASYSQLAVYFRVWGIVRFQWIKSISSWATYSIKKVYRLTQLYFKASSRTILAKKTPLKFQATDCSSIDADFNKQYTSLIEKYFKSDNGQYTLLKDASIKNLDIELDRLIAQNDLQLKIEIQKLVLVSNATQENNYIKTLLRQAQGNLLDEKKLFKAFASVSESKLMALTTYTNENDFKNFLVCLTVHYQKVTRQQQLRRASKQFKGALFVKDVVKEKLLQEACTILDARPSYARTTKLENRIRIAQEVKLGFMATPMQASLLNRTLEALDKDVILKAPPGSGKSSYIRNALSLLISATGLNVINIMPSMQESTLARELEDFMIPLGKHVVRMNISRKSEFSIRRLEHLLRIVKSQERDIVVSTPETYMWLEVHMKLHCYRLTKLNPSFIPQEELRKLQLFLMLLREMKVNSKGLFEEVQVTLKREDRVEVSDGHCSYNPRHANIARQIMNFLVQKTEYAKTIGENSQENLVRDEVKFNELKTYVAEQFLKKWKIPIDGRKKFLDFVLCTENDKDFNEALNWVKLRPHDRDKFAYLKGILNLALPQACKERIDSINGYRLSKLKPYRVPIPCVEKDNPRENATGQSNFHHDVAAMRSFLYYLSEGLTLGDAKAYIKKTYLLAKKQASGKSSLDSTHIGKEFRSLIKKMGLPAEQFPLSTMYGRNELIVAQVLMTSPYGINKFVQRMVTPDIEIYSTTLEASTVNLQSMFNSSVAISATPPTREAYSTNAVVVEDANGDAYMEDLLLNKTSLDGKGGGAHLEVIEGDNWEEVLRDCAQKIALNHSTAIVEASPLFNSKKNKDVAAIFATFLEPFKTYDGVLFCDECDKENKVFDIRTKTIQTLTAEHNQETLFKLYTEAEAFNIHWFSIATGLFEVIIGPKTKWEEAVQAAGRGRLTRILQQFCFVMDKEFRSQFSENVTSKEIVEFLKRNTKLFLELNTFISLGDQISNEPHRYLLNMMSGLSRDKKHWQKDLMTLPDPVKALEIFRQNQQRVFLKKNSTDSWETYATFRTSLNPSTQLKQLVSTNVQTVKGLKGPNFLDRWRMENSLNQYSKHLDNQNCEIPLPNRVNGFEGAINSHVQVMRIPQDESHVKKVGKVSFTGQEYQSDVYPKKLNTLINGGYRPSILRHAAYKTVVFARNYFSYYAYKTSLYIPFVFMGGFSGFAGSFLITNAVLATNVALASLIGMITVIGTNFIFYCGTFLLHLAELAITKINVSYDTHYLKDIVSIHVQGKNKDILNMFANSKVMITNNKFKLWTGTFSNTTQVPFMPDAKELLQVLVIYYKKTGTFDLIDIDIEDSKVFISQMIEDQLNTTDEEANDREWEAAIYDVQTEFAPKKSMDDCFTVKTKGGIHTEELLNSELFHQEMNIIKICNGFTSFTDDQKQALSVLTDKVGQDAFINAQTMENFFLNHALLHRPDRNDYADMEIAHLLNPYARTKAS